ncbi:membrane protein [Streptomyces camponoticapitis]|uniref:Membrane protein n=1 Tax=Streptomyces camponoticapitis TaxID=1616125 RepID=A0ABQ2E6F8_9ACTN|nr:anthrone oxygenase family protein [Streptomyces camponoticapitis]GGJ89148.1 membrane protein [Streptomyces camponoticapitis]
MASVLLALAVVFTGLYAGMMLIFLTGIMPAMARLTDGQFVTAMRRLNEEVPRGLFLLVFLAEVAFPVAALAVPVDDRSDTHLWLLVAGLICVVLNHLVTVAGNIPLNNALASSEASPETHPDTAVRAAFESRWNRFHAVRTVFAVAGFALIVSASLS